MTVETKTVSLDLSGDTEGALVFRDGVLVAVLSRLGPHHGALAGLWNIEAAFQSADAPVHEHFADVDAARAFFDRAA